MRAVVMEQFGGPEVLQVAEVERPVAGLGGVLVRVVAAGINPIDAKVRAGDVGELFGALPLVLGWDVSGVVEELGMGVTGLAVGDEVFGLVRFPEPAGAYAEYVAAPASQLRRKPAQLDHVAAAGLPLTGLTAQQVFDHAGLAAGQRVLIHAAAGGVGHLAVQIAKARGATVIGTARADKHDFLRELGADEVIDYTAGPFEEAVGDIDVVLDPIGGDTGHRSLRVLRPGGRFIELLGNEEAVMEAVRGAGHLLVNHLVHADGPGIARLVELVERGALRVAIDTAVPLEQAAEAHARSETGRAQGKIVLTVAQT